MALFKKLATRGGNAMRMQVLAAFLLGLMLGGCGGSDGASTASVSASDLEGVWVLDTGAFDSFEEFRSLTEPQQQSVRGIAAAMAGMKLTMTSDEMVLEQASREGRSKKTYKVSGIDGANITLDVTHRAGRTDSIPATLQGDQLMIELGGQKVAFKRT